MSSNKEKRRDNRSNVTEMRALRESLGLSRAEFAQKLGVSKIAVLHWENSDRQPSPETFIRLAKLAHQSAPHLALRFWNKAGVDVETLRALVPEIDTMFRSFDRALDAAETQAVPVVRDVDALLSSAPAASREVFKIASAWVPNAAKTVCFAAPDNRMSPVFRNGDLVAVDRSLTAESGDIVLTYLDRDSGNWKQGAHFGWLQHLAVGAKHPVLLQDMESARELSAGQFKDGLPDIASEPGWSVIGPVIWFVGTTGGFHRAAEFKASTPGHSDKPKKSSVTPRASVRPGRSRDRD